MAFYTNRDAVKAALQIPASTTGEATGQRGLINQDIDAAIEGISQLIDDYLGFSPAPTSGTRFYTPRKSDYLSLDYPLLAVDSIQISSDGGTTYGTTFATGSYYLKPYNATMESPPKPFWDIEVRDSCATAVFNVGIQRSARITGTWGYFDQRAGTTAVVGATALDATVTSFGMTGATSLHPGQLILMGSERMLVTQTPASSTGAHTSQISVLRAQHGTAGATHSVATSIEIYEFPIIERAALYQACQDWRVQQAPMGYTGGEGVTQRPVMAGGLHPFARRMLDPMRKPVVA